MPHSAYSAATMLALSGNTVTLHSSAALGPIDPQIQIGNNIVPARLIKRSFENLEKRFTDEGPALLSTYLPLIEKYDIHTLELCDDSVELAKKLVASWLTEYMFEGQGNIEDINSAVRFFSSYDEHLLHSRPITYTKLESQKFRLNIDRADKRLNDLLWEAYILLEGLFSVSPFVKIYENRHGVSWGTNIQVVPTAQTGSPESRSNPPKPKTL